MHDDFGHRGIDGCSQRLKSRFWWPGMDRDIKQYIRTCDLFQRRTHHGKREEVRHRLGRRLSAKRFLLIGLFA
ncbi:hypothetical protein V1527DRAFT_71299 [Lipomyces starkeyi]